MNSIFILPNILYLLFRPPDIDRISKTASRLTNNSISPDGGISLPGSRESCVVTVVNKREPAKRSRVLLNLKTKQSWEDVIKDMGQAIGMKNRASRMLTPWGEEVSVSHKKTAEVRVGLAAWEFRTVMLYYRKI